MAASRCGAGELELDEQDLTNSRFEVEIDASSIDTKEPKRDDHLRSADFFDVAKFPNLTFKSTKVEKPATSTRSRAT